SNACQCYTTRGSGHRPIGRSGPHLVAHSAFALTRRRSEQGAAVRSTRSFYVLMVTQVLSLIGSSMTSIAVAIRIFAETGEATPILLAGFFTALPMMVAGSLAGVLVDRWERRWVLVLCD